jgi:hypothetical protein
MAFSMSTMKHMPTQEHDAVITEAKPYSGMWTKEEQDYVSALVEGFKNGTLDIPDGTSLRCFIASKLGCKAKR